MIIGAEKEKGQEEKNQNLKKKIKPVKAISFKVNKDLYLQIEKIAKENNLSIGQYVKKYYQKKQKAQNKKYKPMSLKMMSA